MTEENDKKRIREMCELAIFRAGENGDYLTYEDLYSIIFEQIKELPEDEKIDLIHQDVYKEIRKAKDEFCDFYILSSPDEDDFGFNR